MIKYMAKQEHGDIFILNEDYKVRSQVKITR